MGIIILLDSIFIWPDIILFEADSDCILASWAKYLGFSGFVSFMLALHPTNDLLTLSIFPAFETPPEPYSTVQRFDSYCLSSLD